MNHHLQPSLIPGSPAVDHPNEWRRVATQCRQALAMNPADAQTLARLGNALLQGGKTEEAIVVLEQAVRLRPEIPWRRALASACIGAGRFADAIRTLTMVAALAPKDREVRLQLAGLHLHLGRTAEAEHQARAALALAPRSAPALHTLGQVFSAQGRHAEAIGAFSEALRLAPGSIDSRFGLATVHQHLGHFSAAETLYTEILRGRPDHHGARINLGNCIQALGRGEEAIRLFRTVLRDDPRSLEGRVNLCSALVQEGRGAEALRVSADYTPPAGREADWSAIRALIFERLGRLEEAAALLRPFVHPDCAARQVVNFAGIAKRLGGERAQEAVGYLRAWLERNTGRVPLPELRAARFLLGDLLDRLGEPDAAFAAYGAANRTGGMRMDRAALLALLTEMERHPPTAAEAPETDEEDGADLVFVLGMPRSGTTLAERIIASHPEGWGAGERTTIGAIAAELGGGEPLRYPARLATLTRGERDALRRRVRDALGAPRGPTRIVDKMPANFLHVGLILRLFPAAHIVHTLRDPRDTCLSCYFQNFVGEHPYKHDLGDLGFYYRLHEGFMDHWQRVFPGRIHVLRYEALIDDFTGEAQRLLDFLGLPWAESCRDFHADAHGVKTASYAQVNRPIYRDSLGRWQPYAAHLGPLFAALEAGVESAAEKQDALP